MKYIISKFIILSMISTLVIWAQSSSDPESNGASAFLIKKDHHSMCLFASAHVNIKPYKPTDIVLSYYEGAQAVGLETTASHREEIFYKIYTPNKNIEENSLSSAAPKSVKLIQESLRRSGFSNFDIERILNLHPMASYRLLMTSVSSEDSISLYPGLDKLLQLSAEKQNVKIFELEPPETLGRMERNTPFQIAVEKAEAAANLVNDKARLAKVRVSALALHNNSLEPRLDKICPQVYDFLQFSLQLPRSHFSFEIEDRNENIVDKIEILLLTNEKSIAAVGAAHFCGQKGIANQLKSRGYSVYSLN